MNVLLTRRFTFSAAHRYWVDEWSAERNLQIFGKPSHWHGHNYELLVTIDGPVDPVTGMAMNVSDLDLRVEAVVAEFDHKNLNEDTPYFRETQPTTESIALVLWRLINETVPEKVRLYRVRLYENADLYVDYTGDSATLTRSYGIAAAHRMHSSAMSAADNAAMYGKCNNPNGHGHNYRVDVTVGGEVDSRSGMLTDIAHLDHQVHRVLDQFDHHRLDIDIADFAHTPATGENILLALWKRLRDATNGALCHLRLRETENNVFEYPVTN